MGLWKVQQRYRKWGLEGLKDHKPGRLFQPLNAKCYDLIVEEWKKRKCGHRKLHAYMKRKGFGVSLWKIRQVMEREGLIKPCRKRRGQKKYKRYEWPLPNLLWHTDWFWCKRLQKYVIVYTDDRSRTVTGHGSFEEATTKHSLFVLYSAITEYGVPYQLLHDRGSQFYANKRNKKGVAEHEYEQALQDLGVIQVKGRAHHPQTNGKCEYFFKILNSEFDDRFKTLDEFVDWFNTERLSEALDYKTPHEVFFKKV